MHDIINFESENQKILTHVIDGFIIEESLSPFPVASNTLTSDQIGLIRKRQQEIVVEDKDVKDENEFGEDSFTFQDDLNRQDIHTCEQCGFSGPRASFSSMRFCSLSCARRYAISHSKRNRTANSSQFHEKIKRKRLGSSQKIPFHASLSHDDSMMYQPNVEPQISPTNSISASSFSDAGDSMQSLSDAGSDFTLSPSSSPNPVHPANETSTRPMNWSVEDVWRYVRSLPDSLQHADEFRTQEIDGSALLLLHEEHLVTSMNLPLGPALKLCAHIDRLREQEAS